MALTVVLLLVAVAYNFKCGIMSSGEYWLHSRLSLVHVWVYQNMGQNHHSCAAKSHDSHMMIPPFPQGNGAISPASSREGSITPTNELPPVEDSLEEPTTPKVGYPLLQ